MTTQLSWQRRAGEYHTNCSQSQHSTLHLDHFATQESAWYTNSVGAWADPSVDLDVAHLVQSNAGCLARSLLLQWTTAIYFLWSNSGFNRSQSQNWLISVQFCCLYWIVPTWEITLVNTMDSYGLWLCAWNPVINAWNWADFIDDVIDSVALWRHCVRCGSIIVHLWAVHTSFMFSRLAPARQDNVIFISYV